MKSHKANFESWIAQTVVPGRFRRAFTLIELMVVVAIMGVIMAAGVPTLYSFLRREGFRKTVNDFAEVCQAARARAILQGVPVRVVFYPDEGRCELVGGSNAAGAGGLATSARLDKTTRMDGLFVDLDNVMDYEMVFVNFYPEGTCDEMTLVLRSDKGEQRGITLEITTSLVTILNQEEVYEFSRGRY